MNSSRRAGLALILLLVLVAHSPTGTSAASGTASAAPSAAPRQPDYSPLGYDCGPHAASNGTQVVAASQAGAAVRVTVGSPSWFGVCEYAQGAGDAIGISFVGYETFPVTIQAAPGTDVTLQTGGVLASPQLADEGNGTVWTSFNPPSVTTGPSGAATSTLTLAGAVMPFTSVSNGSTDALPIIAQASGSVSVANLTIVPTDSVEAVMRAPGPFPLPASESASGSSNVDLFPFGVVYSPGPGAAPQPLNVSVDVLGSWSNGAVAPLPQSISVVVDQTDLSVPPDELIFLAIDINTTATNDTQTAYNLTLALRETVNGQSYTETLALSVSGDGYPICVGCPPFLASPPAGAEQSALGDLSVAIAVAVVVSVYLVAFASLRKRQTVDAEGEPGEGDGRQPP